MVSNIFKLNGLNIHLGYETYSRIAKKCIKEGLFTENDYFCSNMTSDIHHSTYKKIKKKVRRTICAYLKRELKKDYDFFISQYYNFFYYEENAKENISAFLDGVARIYKQIGFIVSEKPSLRFPYGEKFNLCCTKHGKIYAEIMIDTGKIESFGGSVDYFHIHFKNDVTLLFDRGKVSVYNR